MIYTVTLNPSLDYNVEVDHFSYGRVNRTVSESVYPGGKGLNVSRMLKNLGYESTALGFWAGFTGQQLKKLLQEQGIQERLIEIPRGMTRINVKLKSQEETEINGQGPEYRQEDIDKLYQELDCLEAGDILVLAGSIPEAMPREIYRDLIAHVKEKELKIFVDATGELLVNVLEYQPFLIKPNNHELGEIFDTVITQQEEAVCYGRKLQEMGAANVLVSMAGEGAVLLSQDGKICRAKAPRGQVRNSVGAGDSMVAGFLAGYLETGSYETAFEMGICAGSASAFSEKLGTREEVLALRGVFERIE